MLVAHLSPGYFAARYSQKYWHPAWNRGQRVALWGIAIGSTVYPDFDVIHNILFYGVPNHYYATLWTHSIFPSLTATLLTILLHITNRGSYLKTALSLFAIGTFSHLVLDVIAHNTPLFYPLTLQMIGNAPQRIVDGGLRAYITDPLLILEFVLLAAMVLDIITHLPYSSNSRRRLAISVISLTIVVAVLFVALLPTLRTMLNVL